MSLDRNDKSDKDIDHAPITWSEPDDDDDDSMGQLTPLSQDDDTRRQPDHSVDIQTDWEDVNQEEYFDERERKQSKGWCFLKKTCKHEPKSTVTGKYLDLWIDSKLADNRVFNILFMLLVIVSGKCPNNSKGEFVENHLLRSGGFLSAVEIDAIPQIRNELGQNKLYEFVRSFYFVWVARKMQKHGSSDSSSDDIPRGVEENGSEGTTVSTKRQAESVGTSQGSGTTVSYGNISPWFLLHCALDTLKDESKFREDDMFMLLMLQYACMTSLEICTESVNCLIAFSDFVSSTEKKYLDEQTREILRPAPGKMTVLKWCIIAKLGNRYHVDQLLELPRDKLEHFEDYRGGELTDEDVMFLLFGLRTDPSLHV